MEGLSQYEKDFRPWGNFERFTLNENSTVKIITINSGEEFSLQTHEYRDEFWRILKGTGAVTIGEKEFNASEGDTFFSPRHTRHRIAAGSDGLQFLEIAFGEFDEEDIVRLQDKYGRT